jgi:hypothetical protein
MGKVQCHHFEGDQVGNMINNNIKLMSCNNYFFLHQFRELNKILRRHP